MGRPTVLLAEDEPAVRMLAAGVLRAEGYQVVEVQDGVEAIRTLDSKQPPADNVSVVLLDMMLPQVDGMGVLRHLAEHGNDVPVVAMSASAQHLAMAAGAGVQTALAKPFNLVELLDAVGRCGMARR